MSYGQRENSMLNAFKTNKYPPRFLGTPTQEMIDCALSGKANKLKIEPSPNRNFFARKKEPETRQQEMRKYYVPFHRRADNIDYHNYISAINSKMHVFDSANDTLEQLTSIESVTTIENRTLIMQNLGKPLKEIEETQIVDNKDIKKSEPNINNSTDSKHIYDQFNFKNIKYNSNLTIHAHLDDILEYEDIFDTYMIIGTTGCGKTTQVPQYILDKYAREQEYCNIIVAQPRRIAAVTISNRVCAERSWTLGGLCGYQVGLDKSCISDDTRLAYVTNGILLQKLISNQYDKYTHIILDECHERDLDLDMIMLTIKLLKQSNKLRFVKIILMSATADFKTFTQYFEPVAGHLIHLIEIKQKMFHIEEYYLNDCRRNFLVNDAETSKKILPHDLIQFKQDEPHFYEEIKNIIKYIILEIDSYEKKVNNDASNRLIDEFLEKRSTILIFVPGMQQINEICDLIREHLPLNRLILLPLHSDIALEQQRRAFMRAEPTDRKIIIATSIAESSITIPDVKYVIDFCLTKELWCDPYTNYTHLRLEWASKSSVEQRRGRAGRLQDGICIRLIPKEFYARLQEQRVPCIRRQPLFKVILDVKRLNMGPPIEVLQFALEPPLQSNIERTMLLLKEVGALSIKIDNVKTPFDGNLTFAGDIMSSLPIDVKLSKLILLGHCFGRLRECIVLAAALSCKSIFKNYYRSSIEAFKGKWFWSKGQLCDFITILNLYETWESRKRDGIFKTKDDVEKWARNNMIDLYRLREVDMLVDELTYRLKQKNIEDTNDANLIRDYYDGCKSLGRNVNDECFNLQKYLILKIIIAGAFYPNYFVSAPIDDRDAIKLVGGLDLKHTVTLKGFQVNEGILYHDQLNKLVKNWFTTLNENDVQNKFKLSYEDSKAYIEFNVNKETNVTSVPSEVYLSCLIRALRIAIELRKLKPDAKSRRLDLIEETKRKTRAQSYRTDAERKATPRAHARKIFFDFEYDENEEDTSNIVTFSEPAISSQRNTSLLTLSENQNYDYLKNPHRLIRDSLEIDIYIVDLIEFGHFWAHLSHDETTLFEIQSRLNDSTLIEDLQQLNEADLYEGMLCVTTYSDSHVPEAYYRVKIISIEEVIHVLYIDYGNKSSKKLHELYVIPKSLLDFPYQAAECILICMQPDKLRHMNGIWSSQANKEFRELIEDKILRAKIYSIVDSIVRLELFIVERGESTSVHQMCLKTKFCVEAQESSVSQRSNASLLAQMKNIKKQKCIEHHSSKSNLSDNSLSSSLLDLSQSTEYQLDSRDFEGILRLNGPHSPLETRYASLVTISNGKQVRVELESINFACIDVDPQEKHARLMVASSVSLNASGTGLILRKTCQLPKIRGMPTLCLLLFAPSIELRRNIKKTHYTGALCGLGFDDIDNGPLYMDNDIEHTFDCDITNDDLALVNSIRFIVNQVIGSEERVVSFNNDKNGLINIQRLACHKLIQLVEMPRGHLVEEYFRNRNLWNQLLPEEQIILAGEYHYNENESFYSYHSAGLLHTKNI